MPESLATLQVAFTALEAMISQADSQALALVQTFPAQFQALMASLTPEERQSVQPALTEMHRVLQLLQHHVLLWQGAKQKRSERATLIRQDLEQLQQFCQHLSQNLE